ncbi:hypothetical protein BT93_H2858 [Corymbia citriodora subsp. variegata]|nr:hypothetical protein BT93_H2858 [Corymbia citriodora subsp. variegata]
MSTYGPNKSKEMLKNKVKKPYSPISDGNDGEINPRESNSMWSPQQVPLSVPLNSTFGSSVL